jgi:hypothetical protein
MALRRLAAVSLFAALAACNGAASHADGGSAASTADSVTKAVYDNNIDDVTSNFDDQLKTQVSRGEVGVLSDKMHALGAYKGLTFTNGDPAKNEFTYRADFERGSMNVVVRVDQDGKLGACRVFTPSAGS